MYSKMLDLAILRCSYRSRLNRAGFAGGSLSNITVRTARSRHNAAANFNRSLVAAKKHHGDWFVFGIAGAKYVD